jgi:hypothetical protein
MDEIESAVELGEAGTEESNSWFLCDAFGGNGYFASLRDLDLGCPLKHTMSAEIM